MSINVTGSNFSGPTQIGYTNVMGSKIDEMREAVSGDDAVGTWERKEAVALLTELKKKLEGGTTRLEVAHLWGRVEEILSSATKLIPLLTQVGKSLGL